MRRRVASCCVCMSPEVWEALLCNSCQKSYDRHNKVNSTTYGVIRWAAMRARTIERQKWRMTQKLLSGKS